MRIHPALPIAIWCLLVVVMQRLPLLPLCLVTSLIVVVSGYVAAPKLKQLLRRTRWIFLTLLLIYAYATPGSALWHRLGDWSPVREGVQEGAAQLLKLLAALASLAILLHKLPRVHLIAGLYSLLTPLKFLGVSRERCAIRLALTLHYAEVAMLRKNTHWQDALQHLFVPHAAVLAPLHLPLQAMTKLDVAISVVLALFALGLILT
ncbi:MAG: CbiQ family ECF transporter T component [Sideroxydans sp.]|nr:CbiQ family ECF transporter T component [Sideroxydans sp.]